LIFTAGEEKKRGRSRSRPPVAGFFLRRRVARAASDGGVWRRRASNVPAVLWLHRTGPSTALDVLGAVFVILELFNVIFV
jgi:hypothetical protein